MNRLELLVPHRLRANNLLLGVLLSHPWHQLQFESNPDERSKSTIFKMNLILIFIIILIILKLNIEFSILL